MKRKISIFMAMVMVLSLLTAIPANAQAISETARDLQMNREVTFYLGNSNNPNDYKFTTNSKGKLTLSVDSTGSVTRIQMFNSNGIRISPTSNEIITGTWDGWNYNNNLHWNRTVQRANGTFVFDLIEADTYYFRFTGESGKPCTIRATFTPEGGRTASEPMFTITVPVNGRIRLGTTSSADVTWASSRTAVATVSQTGVVRAVARGTTDITATVGNTTLRIRIRVTE
jgi:uncharacterized protein YjdB